MELAASFEDGADHGKTTWLAAKHYERFADHIASYDPDTLKMDRDDLARFTMERKQEQRARDWRRWKRSLNEGR